MNINSVTQTVIIAGILFTIAMLVQEDEIQVETVDDLQSKLQNAVENEDYETAAVIRDKINSLNP
jgi:protein-arginine kinase activator protein McsA